jgi:hypothetical protein
MDFTTYKSITKEQNGLCCGGLQLQSVDSMSQARNLRHTEFPLQYLQGGEQLGSVRLFYQSTSE